MTHFLKINELFTLESVTHLSPLNNKSVKKNLHNCTIKHKLKDQTGMPYYKE